MCQFPNEMNVLLVLLQCFNRFFRMYFENFLHFDFSSVTNKLHHSYTQRL